MSDKYITEGKVEDSVGELLQALITLREAAYNAHIDSQYPDALEAADRVIAKFKPEVCDDED